jgi:hypothetical protein
MSKAIAYKHHPKLEGALAWLKDTAHLMLIPEIIDLFAALILATWLTYKLTPGGVIPTLGVFLLVLTPSHWLTTKGFPFLLLCFLIYLNT